MMEILGWVYVVVVSLLCLCSMIALGKSELKVEALQKENEELKREADLFDDTIDAVLKSCDAKIERALKDFMQERSSENAKKD